MSWLLIRFLRDEQTGNNNKSSKHTALAVCQVLYMHCICLFVWTFPNSEVAIITIILILQREKGKLIN